MVEFAAAWQPMHWDWPIGPTSKRTVSNSSSGFAGGSRSEASRLKMLF